MAVGGARSKFIKVSWSSIHVQESVLQNTTMTDVYDIPFHRHGMHLCVSSNQGRRSKTEFHTVEFVLTSTGGEEQRAHSPELISDNNLHTSYFIHHTSKQHTTEFLHVVPWPGQKDRFKSTIQKYAQNLCCKQST